MSDPVYFDELKAMSGYDSRVADVVQFCRRNRIPVFIGKDGRPSTTRRALDVALGVDHSDQGKPVESIDF